jgi:hypothetical protein
MEIIKSYSLYLNTRESNSGTPDNCNFIFTTPIVLTNRNNRFLISAPMIELPYAFSQVNNTNNTLPYTFNNNGDTYDTDLVFPNGNYNITNLITQLITLLVDNITLRRPLFGIASTDFNISYNSNTSKVNFSINKATIGVFSITLKFSLSYVLGIMFGFPQVNQTFSNNGTILTSSNKVQCNPITSVYMRSESLKFQTNYEAVVQTYNNSDIVAKIPITNLPNSIIYYRNDYKSMINNVELSSINLYLSDNLSTSYTLSMNGVNWGCMLTIDEVQFKPNNSYQDKINNAIVSIPKELNQEREKIILDLLKKKEDLEKELEEKRKLKDLDKKDLDKKDLDKKDEKEK